MTSNDDESNDQHQELLFHLVKAHSDGNITLRQIAALTDLSPEEAYNIVESVYETHDFGDDDPAPKTYTPDDCPQDARNVLGDDVVESMQEDVEAFRAAMERNTQDFLTDPEQ